MKRTITEVYKICLKRKKKKLKKKKKKKKIYYYNYEIIDMINFNKYYPYLFF